MTNRPAPTMPKWAFVLADLLLLAVSLWMIQTVLPDLTTGKSWVVVATYVAWIVGAWICVMPWVEEFRAQTKHLENETLGTAVEQIQKIEEVASRIQTATGSWQAAQDAATRSAAAAREIEEKIRKNTQEFMEFNERVNSDEKKHMSLEIEKLRRVEGEWLQVTARMLDHTYMLNQAGQRSGQANLINQLNNFQNVMRDAVRRMGLVTFVPVAGEQFDGRAHQTETPDVAPAVGAVITEILATGLTFQGQLLRRALVRVAAGESAPVVASPGEETRELEAPETQTEASGGEKESEMIAPEAPGENASENAEATVESVSEVVDEQVTPVAEPVVEAIEEAAPVSDSVSESVEVEEPVQVSATEVVEEEPKPRRRRKTDLQASLPF